LLFWSSKHGSKSIHLTSNPSKDMSSGTSFESCRKLYNILLGSYLPWVLIHKQWDGDIIPPIPTSRSCLVLSCFFRVHPLGGLFLAHAEAGLHCTVQSITPPLSESPSQPPHHLRVECGFGPILPTLSGLHGWTVFSPSYSLHSKLSGSVKTVQPCRRSPYHALGRKPRGRRTSRNCPGSIMRPCAPHTHYLPPLFYEIL